MEMKKGILKRPLILMLLVVILSVTVAANFQTIYNAFTQRLDYIHGNDWSDEKVYFGEVDVANNLTVHGYVAIKENLNNMSVSNLTLTNVTDGVVYDLNFTDLVNNTFLAYAINRSNNASVVLLNSANYSFSAQLGKFSLLTNRWNSFYNITLDYDRFYLPENLSAGDLFVDGWGYFDYVNASIEIFGLQNWTDNQNYPAACPAGSYLTQLGDTVTCTSAWRTTGENATGDYVLRNGTMFFNGSLPLYLGVRFALENGTGAFTYNASYHALLLQNLSLWNESWNKYNASYAAMVNQNLSLWNESWNKYNATYAGYQSNVSLNWSLNTQSMWDEVWLSTANASYTQINATTDQNMTNNKIWDVSYLYFHLGEYIENLVDGWIKVAANLFVDGNLNVTGATTLNDNLNMSENDITNVRNLTYDAYIGELWFHNDTSGLIVTTINTQNVYENVTGFNSSDSGNLLRGYSFNPLDNYISPSFDGMYWAGYTLSFLGGANSHYQFSIAVNGVLQPDTDSHRKIGASADVGNTKGGAYIPLSSGDFVQLQVRNIDNTNDINPLAANLNLERKGN